MLVRHELLFGNKLGACAYDFGRRAVRHEGIDELAAKGFGSALQRVERNHATEFCGSMAEIEAGS